MSDPVPPAPAPETDLDEVVDERAVATETPAGEDAAGTAAEAVDTPVDTLVGTLPEATADDREDAADRDAEDPAQSAGDEPAAESDESAADSAEPAAEEPEADPAPAEAVAPAPYAPLPKTAAAGYVVDYGDYDDEAIDDPVQAADAFFAATFQNRAPAPAVSRAAPVFNPREITGAPRYRRSSGPVAGAPAYRRAPQPGVADESVPVAAFSHAAQAIPGVSLVPPGEPGYPGWAWVVLVGGIIVSLVGGAVGVGAAMAERDHRDEQVAAAAAAAAEAEQAEAEAAAAESESVVRTPAPIEPTVHDFAAGPLTLDVDGLLPAPLVWSGDAIAGWELVEQTDGSAKYLDPVSGCNVFTAIDASAAGDDSDLRASRSFADAAATSYLADARDVEPAALSTRMLPVALADGSGEAEFVGAQIRYSWFGTPYTLDLYARSSPTSGEAGSSAAVGIDCPGDPESTRTASEALLTGLGLVAG